MSAPGTAREALLADAIGDLGRLLAQAEALLSAMSESSEALVAARHQLVAQLATFETHVAALSEKAKVQAVKHILTRTDDAARRSVDAQTRAMGDAAQQLFKAEIAPALQRLAAPLQQLVQRVDRPWECWLTHAATAVVAAFVTCALTAWLWVR